MPDNQNSPRYSITVKKGAATLTYIFEPENELTPGKHTLEGFLKCTTSVSPDIYSTFYGVFLVDIENNMVRLLEGIRTSYIGTTRVLVTEGLFNEEEHLDSYLMGEGSHKECTVTSYHTDGRIAITTTGTAIDSRFIKATITKYPVDNSTDVINTVTYSYTGKLAVDVENTEQGESIYHDDNGVLVINDHNGTFLIHIGFDYGKNISPAFIVSTANDRITSISTHSSVYVVNSKINTNNAIWKATFTEPNIFVIDSMLADALDSTLLREKILNIISLLAERNLILPPHPQDIEVNLHRDTEAAPIVNHASLFGLKYTLEQGMVDKLGLLSGDAIAHINFDSGSRVIKGYFRLNTLEYGEICDTYGFVSRQVLKIPQNPTDYAELTDFQVQKQRTIIDRFPRRSIIWESFLFKTPENINIKRIVKNPAESLVSEYNGQIRNEKPYGQGTLTITSDVINGKQLQIVSGIFSIDSALPGVGGVIKTTTHSKQQKVESHIDIKTHPTMKVIDNKVFYLFDGSEKTTAYSITQDGVIEETYTAVAEGSFKTDNFCSGTVTLSYHGKPNTLITQKGTFKNGAFFSGDQIHVSEQVTEHYHGELTPSDEFAVLGRHSIYHDPHGVLVINNARTKTIVWQRNFSNGKSTYPFYEVKYNKQHQLISITQPGEWSITRNPDGTDVFKKLSAAGKKPSPKEMIMLENKAKEILGTVEQDCLRLEILTRFHSTLQPSLEQLAADEENEKREKKKALATKKKEQDRREAEAAQKKSEKKSAQLKKQKERIEQEKKAKQESAERQRKHDEELCKKYTPPELPAADIPLSKLAEEDDEPLDTSSEEDVLLPPAAVASQEIPLETIDLPPKEHKDTAEFIKISETEIVDTNDGSIHKISKQEICRPDDSKYIYMIREDNLTLKMHTEYEVTADKPLTKNAIFSGTAKVVCRDSQTNQEFFTQELNGTFLCHVDFSENLLRTPHFRLRDGTLIKRCNGEMSTRIYKNGESTASEATPATRLRFYKNPTDANSCSGKFMQPRTT